MDFRSRCRSLHATTIAQYQEHKRDSTDDLLVLRATDTIQSALKKLCERQVHGAPVQSDDSVIGFFDVRDLVSAMLEAFSKGRTREELNWAEFETDFQQISVRGMYFGTRLLSEVVNASGSDGWATVYASGTLGQLAEEMVAAKAHRVGVVSEKNVLHSVVSVSELVTFVATHASEWAAADLPPVGVLFPMDVPISMSWNAPAIQAFYLMHVHRVSGVAILDESGALVGNVSAADLRDSSYTQIYVPTTFRDLFLPLRSFLVKKAGRSSGSSVHSAPPVSCSPGSTLETVTLQMAMFGVHRVYVVDEKRHPVGVITAFDVLRKLSE